MQKNEKFFVSDHLGTPCCAIYGLQPFKFLFGEVEALPFDVFVVRGPADGRFFALGMAVSLSTIHLRTRMLSRNPGHMKLPSASFSEPVHMENAGRLA